jgi:hypothetical protein
MILKYTLITLASGELPADHKKVSRRNFTYRGNAIIMAGVEAKIELDFGFLFIVHIKLTNTPQQRGVNKYILYKYLNYKTMINKN